MDGKSKWTKSETRNGIPYYINHESEVTQWDHPDLVSAVAGLATMDNIYFGAYRTAAKLRRLQKVLHMDVVNLITVRMAFELHGFSRHNDSVMDVVQLYNIIHEMFDMTRLRGRSTLRVDRCSDVLLNWILNLYDVQRTGCLRVLPVKLGIATVCAGRITDKYRYFQDLLSDRTGRINRMTVTEFMHDVMQIPDMLGEGSTFRKSVQPSVDDCFQSAIGPAIMQDEFYHWLKSEPQTLVWLPTLHRCSLAETMKHETKCNTCKMYPIVGLRYQCLKCFNYDLCQDCFFTRQASKNHKLGHPMQEYCMSSKSKEDVKAFTKTVRNNLSKKHGRRIKRKYRPIQDGWSSDEDRASDDPELETHVRLRQMSDRLKLVEEEFPPHLDDISPRDNASTQPSVKSTRQSVVTATTDDSRYHERRELEDLIDALERENDELIDDIEHMGLAYLGSVTSDDSEPEDRQLKPRRHDDTAVVERRNEVLAKQEVLEEHNRRLEDQLTQLRILARKSQDIDPNPDKDYIGPPSSQGFNHSSGYQASSLSGAAQQNSGQSSGYLASSGGGYVRTGERLPPYGQSHPALDTIVDHSSKSSADLSGMPRFVMRGSDRTDGQNQPIFDPASGQYLQSSVQYLHNQPNMVVNPGQAQPGRLGHLMQNPRMDSGGVNVRGLANIQRVLQGGSVQSQQANQYIQPLQPTYSNEGLQMSNQHSNYMQGLNPITSQSGHGIIQSEQSHVSRYQTDQSHASRFQTDQSGVSDQSRHARFQPDTTESRASQSRNAFTSHDAGEQRALHMDKSRALESILDLERFLPNLDEQSTVHFPAMAASMAYPSEEAELNEMMQRVTNAFPNSDLPPSPEPEEPIVTIEELLEPRPQRRRGARQPSGDLFSAANRIGSAMSSLVTRVSVGGADQQPISYQGQRNPIPL